MHVAVVVVVQWFEEKQLQIEEMEEQMKKLHSALETLVAHRRGSFVSISDYGGICITYWLCELP